MGEIPTDNPEGFRRPATSVRYRVDDVTLGLAKSLARAAEVGARLDAAWVNKDWKVVNDLEHERYASHALSHIIYPVPALVVRARTADAFFRRWREALSR